jgi:spermidine synthase
VPEAKRALVLGHGGGSFAKWLARYWPDLDLDVVEFDPVVVRMAEDYFSYRPPSRHHVYVRDARAYLNGTANTYDLIWVDAFARHLVPFHLTTQEFFADLRKHLRPEGVVVVNLAASGNRGDFGRAQAVVQTMKQSFPLIETYAVKGPWPSKSRAENLLFFAGAPVEHSTEFDFAAKVAALVERQRLPSEAIALLSTRRTEPWESGAVLTDDYAPYDLLIGTETGEDQPRGDR